MPTPNGSIGSFSFIKLDGVPSPGGLSLEEISRDGADGVALREKEIRPLPFQMTSVVDCNNAGAMKDLLVGYMAMRGTLQTVVDTFGNSWPNVAVLNVEPVPEGTRKILSAVGGLSVGMTHLLAARWTLQLTEEVALEEEP